MSPDAELESLLKVLIDRFGPTRTLAEVYATTYGLRAYREGRTLSLADIADYTGIAKQNLSRWMRRHIETDHVVMQPDEDDARRQEIRVLSLEYACRHLPAVAEVIGCAMDPARDARRSKVVRKTGGSVSDDVTEELVEAGRGYERLFVPALFEPWTKHLIDGARVRQGSYVLDVACGTGVLARRARERAGPRGRVVGIDPAPGMLAAAREIEPSIDWRLGIAEALELADESFDCVVSQFGMMFFQDLPKASDEMLRVLKPGGSLAVAIWNSVEHNPAYADIIAVLEEHVGTAAADALRLPYRLGDAAEVTGVLEDAGFTGIRVVTKGETATFPSSRHMVEAELRGWLPLFDIHLSEPDIREVLNASDRTLAKYAGSSGEAVFPTSAHIITARR